MQRRIRTRKETGQCRSLLLKRLRSPYRVFRKCCGCLVRFAFFFLAICVVFKNYFREIIIATFPEHARKCHRKTTTGRPKIVAQIFMHHRELLKESKHAVEGTQ